ncbi:glutathione S-transferase family protein [Pseudomonas putida]|uniref:glutathione S-transferase family protein n=1 Tax=Pseudomonas putida TaxID=303 RepID=UPI0020C5B2AB|nr:glutathione S-transferase family protein [Pseudomonas putida]UTL83338.1 glutathione S-transferase family protein [Pseudomonas putida]
MTALMTLHWSPLSPFVRKVMCVIHEHQLQDEVRCVRTKVSRHTPNDSLTTINPLLRIPTLELSDGVALFDSVVICEYLDTLGHGPRLYPYPSDARWQALRWQALGDGLCDTLILWRHERDRPDSQQQQDFLKASALKLSSTLQMLEKEVEQLDAARYGIGHIAIGCALGYLAVRFDDLVWRDKYLLLAHWQQRFEARESSRLTAPPQP